MAISARELNIKMGKDPEAPFSLTSVDNRIAAHRTQDDNFMMSDLDGGYLYGHDWTYLEYLQSSIRHDAKYVCMSDDYVVVGWEDTGISVFSKTLPSINSSRYAIRTYNTVHEVICIVWLGGNSFFFTCDGPDDGYITTNAFQSVQTIRMPFTGGDPTWADIVKMEDNVFIALSSNESISRTTDNGASWTAVTPSSFSDHREGTGVSLDGNIYDIRGYTSNNYYIRKSTNNGATWSSLVLQSFNVNPTIVATPTRLVCVYDIVCTASATHISVLSSTDGGTTWSSEQYEAPYFQNGASVYDEVYTAAYGESVVVSYEVLSTNGVSRYHRAANINMDTNRVTDISAGISDETEEVGAARVYSGPEGFVSELQGTFCGSWGASSNKWRSPLSCPSALRSPSATTPYGYRAFTANKAHNTAWGLWLEGSTYHAITWYNGIYSTISPSEYPDVGNIHDASIGSDGTLVTLSSSEYIRVYATDLKTQTALYRPESSTVHSGVVNGSTYLYVWNNGKNKIYRIQKSNGHTVQINYPSGFPDVVANMHIDAANESHLMVTSNGTEGTKYAMFSDDFGITWSSKSNMDIIGIAYYHDSVVMGGNGEAATSSIAYTYISTNNGSSYRQLGIGGSNVPRLLLGGDLCLGSNNVVDIDDGSYLATSGPGLMPVIASKSGTQRTDSLYSNRLFFSESGTWMAASQGSSTVVNYPILYQGRRTETTATYTSIS